MTGRASPLNRGKLNMANKEYVVMQTIGHDGRALISKHFWLGGTASLATFGVRRAAAQAQGTLPPIQRSQRYDDSFITQRKSFKWPGDNTLAVWFAPNVEVWQYNSAFGVGISPNPTNYLPDVFNYAWRELGCASDYGVSLMSSIPPALRRPSH
jgi:hypothetical protein